MSQKFHRLEKLDLFDFDTCRKELQKYRQNHINHYVLGRNMMSGNVAINVENCKLLEESYIGHKKYIEDISHYYCDEEMKKVSANAFLFLGFSVTPQDYANIAAIGWTQSHGKVIYNCGGAIITEYYIVTAAHCKFHNRKQPDTVRLGDRYLVTTKDDEHAQQLKIQEFIAHPEYNSNFNYNDIAMIRTDRKIIFNEFVVPSCVSNVDIDKTADTWNVAGYGLTEKGVPSNELLELKARYINNEECNKTYSDIDALPRGIVDSQFCVKSRTHQFNRRKPETYELNIQISDDFIPDTCQGDSGSPAQYFLDEVIKDNDFNQTYIERIYKHSILVGLVSFGLGCGFNVPSVYTNIYYYKNWMKSVVDEN